MSADDPDDADAFALPARFEALETIASSDAEIVLRARDRTLLREVVLKRPGPAFAALLGSDAAAADGARTLREARTLAKVRHTNVVRLLDVIECNGGPLLVLEPVAGVTLDEHLRARADGRLPPAAVLDLALGLADALAAIHDQGAVHRGLATGSIVLRPDGTPCIESFRFAKTANPFGGSSILYQGGGAEHDAARALLPEHPAPEQVHGQAADARSDLFALGCVLYRCLTGRAAFDDLVLTGWRAPADPATLAPDAPKPLCDAIGRCLARSPLARFQSARELREALEQVRRQQQEARTLVPAAAAPGRDRATTNTANTAARAATGTRGPRRRTGAAAAVLAFGAIAALGVYATRDRSGVAADAGDAGAVASVVRGRRAEVAGDAAPAGAYATTYRRSRALLIGIGDTYAARGFAALPNAERDVAAVADRLAAMPWESWEVRTLLGAQATRQAILQAKRDLEEALEPDDRALIYYAGHGLRHANAERSGWLVPADAVPDERDPSRSTWLRFDEFARFFDEARAKHVLLLLDCCYSGRLATSRAAGSAQFEERYLASKAHVVIASGRGDQEVSDGMAGERSPFATAFLHALDGDGADGAREAAITSSMLFAEIQRAFDARGIAQIPQMGHPADGAFGEFVFFLHPRD